MPTPPELLIIETAQAMCDLALAKGFQIDMGLYMNLKKLLAEYKIL